MLMFCANCKTPKIELTTSLSSNKDISLEGLHEETEVFMFAGHDTTTTTLCYTLGFITENPTIRKKCLTEINTIMGDSSRNK